MRSELTNLLPPERERAFRGEYYLRLAVLGATALGIVGILHGALLFPSYLYLANEAAVERAHLADLTATLASSEEAGMSARVAKLETDATRIMSLVSGPSGSEVVRSLLAVPHSGVSLTGFSYDAPDPDGRLVLRGLASTRESLRKFHESLSALPSVRRAELPLSAYAKENDIDFSITLTGPLLP